jgi:hypothetical protein
MVLGSRFAGIRGTGRAEDGVRAIAVVMLFLALTFGAAGACAEAVSDDAIWTASYDPVTETRFIPLELILGARWDGRREIVLPAGDFTEGVPPKMNPSTWRGPVEWRHPQTGALLMVYDRSRHGVVQKFAVRTDGTAIGRVTDNRFEIGSCDQEGKYPLGVWRQGEARQFDYRCWRVNSNDALAADMITTITIEKIDFSYGAAAHSLQIHWILKQKKDGRELDNRIYVFSPGRGMVYVR